MEATREFLAEIKVLTRVHHLNLVRYCLLLDLHVFVRTMIQNLSECVSHIKLELVKQGSRPRNDPPFLVYMIILNLKFLKFTNDD